MLRAPLRRTPRLLANASARAVKPRVPRRFASSDSHHGSAKHGSDLPWLIPSVGITVPLVCLSIHHFVSLHAFFYHFAWLWLLIVTQCFWLWSTTPKMEEDHRWERRAARVAAKKKEEEEHAKQQEEQARAEEEKKNVEGGDETTEGGEESNPSDETSPVYPPQPQLRLMGNRMSKPQATGLRK